MADQSELTTYRGNCHCADYIYEVKLPELKTVGQCNCSICYKRSALWAVPRPGSVTFVKGNWDALTTYSFNTGTYHHKFCPTCGTFLLMERQPKLDEFEFALNVRAMQNIDIDSLEKTLTNGMALPPAYEPHKFTGIAPTAELEGGQVYTGSCHCGAVRLAVKSKPLDASYSDKVIECNCSLDGRYGCTWIYPENKYVTIDGEENLTMYAPGRKVNLKGFCKVCGVTVTSRGITAPEEVVAAMPEQAKFWYDFGRTHSSINTRLLDGVDITVFNVFKVDGWNNIKPGYVNP